MTASEQIRSLEHLHQAAAASLLAMSPRRLRDTGCPKNRDGMYSARDVIAWRLDHLTVAEIVEGINHLDEKQILTVADAIIARLKSLLK